MSVLVAVPEAGADWQVAVPVPVFQPERHLERIQMLTEELFGRAAEIAVSDAGLIVRVRDAARRGLPDLVRELTEITIGPRSA
jgi:hypothetical protein